MLKYQIVIGLEIHCQMRTKQKLFSPALFEQGPPNIHVDWFDAALPGSLPVLNPEAVHLATRAGLCLGAKIHSKSHFDRKHYFYPDLPSGYQITQYFSPFAKGGSLVIDGRRIGIEQIQIEQDSGKTITQDGQYIDLNRNGLGVLEIVTKPELHSKEETIQFLKRMQHLLWYNQIIPPEMDEGAFRSDVNISIKRPEQGLQNRVELKHIVKFSSIEKAIEYETQRQISLLENNQTVEQETRGFDLKTGKTYRLRSKEEMEDYNYIPDADVPPLLVSQDYISHIQSQMPEPLKEREERLLSLGLTEGQVQQLVNEPGLSEYFEKSLIKNVEPQRAFNWITIDLQGNLKHQQTILDCDLAPVQLGKLLLLIQDKKVSQLQAKKVLQIMMTEHKDPWTIVQEQGWVQEQSEEKLESICKQVIEMHPSLVKEIQNGKHKAIPFLVGQVMKQTKGSADPVKTREYLTKLLIK